MGASFGKKVDKLPDYADDGLKEKIKALGPFDYKSPDGTYP